MEMFHIASRYSHVQDAWVRTDVETAKSRATSCSMCNVTTQGKILGAVPLDVSLQHLSNYVLVWELQPFIQSDLLELLELGQSAL